MTIKEIHGFDFGGKVYATREEAERAERISAARQEVERHIRDMASALAAMLHSNFFDNGDRHRTADGVCEDLLPVHRDDRCEDARQFMGALNRGLEALDRLRFIEGKG